MTFGSVWSEGWATSSKRNGKPIRSLPCDGRESHPAQSVALGGDGMRQGAPRPAASCMHARTRGLYDALSPWYDLLAAGQENAVRAAAIEALALQPGEHVLEVGFGTGSALVGMGEAVTERGSVWGVDLSWGMARVAQRRQIGRASCRER